MSELTARHLIDKGAKTIFVSNRNLSHAQELAENLTVLRSRITNLCIRR